MMNRIRVSLVTTAAAYVLAGCATWSTSSVDQRSADAPANAPAPARTITKTPTQITVTDKDMVNRKYVSLGDISVTVNKTTIFHADPTPELVNQKLREKAAEMGADMVILVRYGQGGVSFMSWGSLEGKGRAIRFVQ